MDLLLLTFASSKWYCCDDFFKSYQSSKPQAISVASQIILMRVSSHNSSILCSNIYVICTK